MDRPNMVDLTAVMQAASMVSRYGGATDVARALEAIATGDLARLYRVAALVEAHAGYPDGLGFLATLAGEATGSGGRDTRAYGRLKAPRRALAGQITSDYTDAASRSARSARDDATRWSGRVAHTDLTVYASHRRAT